ncbi:MAG: rhodanese-like domain-containing protein [Bacteroidota bacterium]|nr:rhodanese-like domain-containing protein [Bacteroidota bacterium]
MLRNFSCFLIFLFFSCSKIYVHKEATFSSYYKKKSSKILIDVRTPEEFKSGQAIEAINIDFYNENFETDLLKISRNKEIYLYCRSGRRSGIASQFLIENGYRNVYNIDGGTIKMDSIYLNSSTFNN